VRTLVDLIRVAAARTPDAPAVHGVDESLTYAELWTRAGAWSAALASAGVAPGDRVGLYQPKTVSALAQVIGVLRRGAAYVPIDPAAPPARAAFVAEHCQLKLVLAAGRQLRTLAKAELTCEVLDASATTGERAAASDAAASDDPAATDAAASDDAAATHDAESTGAGALPTDGRPLPVDLAYVLYTSGSTGTPKGVAITHGQSLAFVDAAVETFGFRGDDVFASHAPLNFDLSIIDLFCAFAAGASVEILPDSWLAFAAKLAQRLEDRRVTVWNSVPSALIQMVERGALADRTLALRWVLFAGEPYPVAKLRALADAVPDATLVNVYGQTEANSSTFYMVDAIEDLPPTSDVSTSPDGSAPPAAAPPPTLPIGRPFPGYEILLLDADDAPICDLDVEGEIVVRGAAVARGYFDDPERTRAAFVPNPLATGSADTVYRTGDRGAWGPDGVLLYRGRTDRAVKVRGFRVELTEVEATATSVDGVDGAAVIAATDETTGHALHLFYVGDVDPGSHLSRQLPKYMLPATRTKLGALPRGANGKVDYAALRDLLIDG